MKAFFVVVALALALGPVGQVCGQDNPFVRSFLSNAEKLRKSLEAEIRKCEAASMEEFRLLKERTVNEIDLARKAKMADDDLDGALTLRNAAKEVENTKWDFAKPTKSKRVEWEFTDRNGNLLVRQPDGKWAESSDAAFIWDEKQRNEICIVLYDPKRDLWGRLYDDGFFVQFPDQRKDNSWHLLEGKWIR